LKVAIAKYDASRIFAVKRLHCVIRCTLLPASVILFIRSDIEVIVDAVKQTVPYSAKAGFEKKYDIIEKPKKKSDTTK